MIKNEYNNIGKQGNDIKLIPVMENNEFDFVPMYIQYVKNLSNYGEKLRKIYENCTYEEGTYKVLSYYFSNSDRFHVYLIEAGEAEYVGFCIITDYPLNKNNTIFPNNFYAGAYDISEFYIKPKYRCKGYGEKTFKKITYIYKTKGTLSILNKNVQAIEFWNKMFDRYTINVFCAANKSNNEICEYSFTPKFYKK
jgi:predicted acetyltransferase